MLCKDENWKRYELLRKILTNRLRYNFVKCMAFYKLCKDVQFMIIVKVLILSNTRALWRLAKYLRSVYSEISLKRWFLHKTSSSLKNLAKVLNLYVMACRFLEYCDENSATVDVERKEKVEDIADTLRGLKLLSAASSGKELILSWSCLFPQEVKPK